MTLLVPWLGFPLVLGLLALGCGELVRMAARPRLPGALVVPIGLALVSVVAGFTTVADRTAELTVPLVVALGATGLAIGRPWRRRLDGSAVVCAAAVYLAFAAPVVAHGEATFAGYVKLDDTATFLALTDRVLEHGRSLDGLAPSTYEATLDVNLARGYPVGSLLPLGIGTRLVGEDPAWTYQPYLALLAAVLALSLYELAGGLVRSPAWRAVAAATAAQAALLYGFALWGGVKEVYAAAAVALVAATVAHARTGGAAALAPALAVAALLGAASLGGAVWLAPVLALAVAGGMATRAAVRLAVLAAALSLPALLATGQFLRSANRESFGAASELGNLVRPLSLLQVGGVWPAGDFRFTPEAGRVTAALLLIVFAGAAVGVALAVRRRELPLALYAACCAAGVAASAVFTSPWLAAKALAIASPAPLLLAVVGAASLGATRWRPAGAAAAVLVAGGVAWSNGLAFRSVSLAPRDELAELETIGSRFAGTGPALMTEYEPYGVRHFLRRVDAEGASELRRRLVPLRDGSLLAKGRPADLDLLDLDGVLVYRLLVLQRSGHGSRPPASYRLAWRGDHYEVWQRDPSAPSLLAHLPLGAGTPTATARCADVLQVAHTAARAGGVVAAAGPDASGPPLVVAPARWQALCGRRLDWIEALGPPPYAVQTA